MKAISLWQPWASALASGAKQYETRSWKVPASILGEIVAIHASVRWGHDEQIWAQSLARIRDLGYKGTPPLGCIVGIGRIFKCCPTEELYGPDFEPTNFWSDPRMVEYQFGDFGPGRYAWGFSNVVQLARPIACVGRQGFFTIDQEVERCLREQLEGME